MLQLFNKILHVVVNPQPLKFFLLLPNCNCVTIMNLSNMLLVLGDLCERVVGHPLSQLLGLRPTS